MPATPVTTLRISALRTLLLALLATPSLSGCGDSSSPIPPPPPFSARADDDAFYAQSPEDAARKPGTVLGSRAIRFAFDADGKLAVQAWQLRFSSRNSQGLPIIAIATVVRPLAPILPHPAVVSFQYAEDSLGAICAPSHTLTGSQANPISLAESALPLPLLEAGYTLIYPDHEGPQSAYAAGPLAGRITLDALRAAQQFAPLGLSAGSSIGLWGYSGGAIATAWAAALQPRYAPELPIQAVAIGGTPADLIGVLRNADQPGYTNRQNFSLVLSAVAGVNREYPAFITPILNARGQAALRALTDGCAGSTSDGSPEPQGHFADYTTVADPFASAGFIDVGPQISLPQPGLAPNTDVFVYHSQFDELIPIQGADTLVQDWCAAGTAVHYFRGALGGHVLFQITHSAAAIDYLEDRLSDLDHLRLPPGTRDCPLPAAR